MRSSVGLGLVLFLSAALASGTYGAGGEESLPNAPLELHESSKDSAAQRRIVEQLEKAALRLEALLQEGEENRFSADELRAVRASLESLRALSSRQAPAAAEALSSNRPEDRRQAQALQAALVSRLEGLLADRRREQAPSRAQHALSEALERQSRALEKLRELRAAREHLDGVWATNLSEEDRRALGEALDRQSEAETEIRGARSELEGQVRRAAPADPQGEGLREALQILASRQIAERAGRAAADLQENRIHQAELAEESLLFDLRQAERCLWNGLSPRAAEERLQLLSTIHARAEEVCAQTRGLERRDLAAAALAARNQAHLGELMRDAEYDDAGWQWLIQKSDAIRELIVRDRASQASDLQEEFLTALDGMQARAEQEWTRERSDQVQAQVLARNLDALHRQAARQQEMLDQTPGADPARAHLLARSLAELAASVLRLAQNFPAPALPATGRTPPQDPRQLLELAGKTQREAARQLADGQTIEAESSQRKALELIWASAQGLSGAVGSSLGEIREESGNRRGTPPDGLEALTPEPADPDFNWRLALPPAERKEVEEGLRQADQVPPEFRPLVRNYYRSLRGEISK